MKTQNKLITLNNKIYKELNIPFQFNVIKNILYKRIDRYEKIYFLNSSHIIQNMIDKNKSYSNLIVDVVDTQDFTDIIIRNKTVEEIKHEQYLESLTTEEFIFDYMQELLNK